MRTFKYMLYKRMCMRAASCVCELRPALNVPNEDVYELVSERDRLQKAAKNEKTGRAEKGHETTKQDQN